MLLLPYTEQLTLFLPNQEQVSQLKKRQVHEQRVATGRLEKEKVWRNKLDDNAEKDERGKEPKEIKCIFSLVVWRLR